MPTDLRWSLVAYALLIVGLFHRLFIGEILHPGVMIFTQAPFFASAPADMEVYCNTIAGDVWRQHAAWQRYQYDAARRGRFPLWNPHEFLGMPFHGNGQTALLHPYSWAFYVLDPNWVRGPLAGLRLWISAAATCILLRRWGWSAGGAFVGGLVWLFAPFNIRWLLWPLSHSSLWLPVLVLAFDCFLVRPSARRFAWCGLAATVLQLSGHPETQFQAGIVAGCCVLFRLPTTAANWGAALRRLVQCLAAMVAGVVGAAAQLLPFLVQLPQSADWLEHVHGSPTGLAEKAWILFLAADFYGRPCAGHTYEGPANYIEAGCGFGLIPLGFALAAIVSCLTPHGIDRRRRWLGGGAAVCGVFFTLLLFGSPLVEPAMRLPLLDQANRHRWTMAIQFFGAVVAGLGFDLATRGRGWQRWLSAALVGALTLILFAHLFDRVPARFSKIKSALKETHWRSVVHHPAVRTTACLVCAAAAAGLLLRRSIRRRSSSWIGLAALIAAEGIIGAWDFNPTAPAALADPPAPPLLLRAIALAGEDRLAATDEVLYPNLAVRFGYREVSGYDWPLPTRIAGPLRKLGWRVVEGVSLPRSAILPHPSPTLAAFLVRVGVRILYTDLREQDILFESNEVWPQVADGDLIDGVYINPAALPRARLPRRAVAGTAEEGLAALLDPDLTRPDVIEILSTTPAIPPVADGEARLVKDDPEEVVIVAKTSTGGLVILADRMAPGWSVAVDGAPAEALTVDYLLRGVIAPPGEHRIVWTYDAPGFRLGVLLSLSTMAVFAALLFLPQRPLQHRSENVDRPGVKAHAE